MQHRLQPRILQIRQKERSCVLASCDGCVGTRRRRRCRRPGKRQGRGRRGRRLCGRGCCECQAAGGDGLAGLGAIGEGRDGDSRQDGRSLRDAGCVHLGNQLAQHPLTLVPRHVLHRPRARTCISNATRPAFLVASPKERMNGNGHKARTRKSRAGTFSGSRPAASNSSDRLVDACPKVRILGKMPTTPTTSVKCCVGLKVDHLK